MSNAPFIGAVKRLYTLSRRLEPNSPPAPALWYLKIGPFNNYHLLLYPSSSSSSSLVFLLRRNKLELD